MILSTSWYPKRVPTLDGVLDAGRRLGVTDYEIGVSRVPFDLAAWKEAVAAGIRVASIHNIAEREGLAASEMRGENLSSLDAGKRGEAVKRTLRTLRIARELGAKAVVLHLGAIAIPRAEERQYGAFKTIERRGFSPRLALRLDRLRAERKKHARPHIEAAVASLERILPEANGLRLGIEGRFFYHEIPDYAEMGEILARFPGDALGYWHDIGHAHIMAWLGFYRRGDWLAAYRERLVGVHLHDAMGSKDHLPPGAGEVPFAEVIPYLAPGVLRVLELSPSYTEADLAGGMEYLKRCGIT
ncbi:MAG: TIM barrel protein [Planctomycetota bacterium]